MSTDIEKNNDHNEDEGDKETYSPVKLLPCDLVVSIIDVVAHIDDDQYH